MAENITTTVEEMNNEQYIAAIEELKANTVSRDSYNKLRNENKQLLDALVSGKELPQEPVKAPSTDELRKKLFSGEDMSNLEYVETALALRNSLIGAGERDPFLPYGEKVDITQEQIDAAEKVAAGLQEMVDFAEGDSGIFSAEYQRRVKDVAIPRGRK
jgi:hypothetical protein